MMSDDAGESNAGSHVNRIPGVKLDDAGIFHTPFGSYHPATGEGLPIDAPKELMRKILIALLRFGEESGLVEPFDFDDFMKEVGLGRRRRRKDSQAAGRR